MHIPILATTSAAVTTAASKGFGAIKSSGGALDRWVDVSAQVSAPEGYKHGTVVTIARSRWKEIRQSFSRVGTYSHFA